MAGNGWIKLHRSLMRKGYYKKSHYVHLWGHLLMKANHKENEFMWNNGLIIVKEGQLITGRKQLSDETGISESSIERILKMFENEQQIEQQKTTKFRVITILNWKEYQGCEQQNGQQTDNRRTTDGQQTDTNKNDKKNKNEKNDNNKEADDNFKPLKLREAVIIDPSQLFIRYFPRPCTPQDKINCQQLINDFGVDIVLYAFHQANKHSAFSIAYVEKVCASKKAKDISVAIETKGRTESIVEKQEMKLLEARAKKADDDFNNSVIARFRKIKDKITAKKLTEIKKAIDEGVWLRADRLVYEVETGVTKKTSIEISGMQTIEDSIGKILG